MNSVLIVVLLWLVPNVWGTFRVARTEMPQHKKAILIIGIWLVPILGLTMALWEIPSDYDPLTVGKLLPRAGQATARPAVAPDSIHYAGHGPFPLLVHLSNRNGVPVLDWAALAQWACGNPQAIEAGRRAWLLHVRDGMSSTAHLHETPDAWVLSSFTPRTARAVAVCVTDTRRRIAGLLEGIAEFPADARSILVVLENRDEYDNYLSNYHPEHGEPAFSGGRYIDYGCPHLVVVFDKLSKLEPVIAREMTHGAVAHLEMPLWLDEGIAVATEHQVALNPHHARDTVEKSGRHLEFWNDERIQEFWTGTSFTRTDSHWLSHDLARSIVELLGKDRSSFVEFASNASRDDAGAAAASGILKRDLGDIAAAALDLDRQPGWSPKPGRTA
jgi:hypothetical protein